MPSNHSNTQASSATPTQLVVAEDDQFPTLIKVSQTFVSDPQIAELLKKNDSTMAVFNDSIAQAFTLIMSSAVHFRFPIRTVCTSMVIFQQFFLFNKIASYNLLEVVCACVFVASKIQDTPKKSKDIIRLLFDSKKIHLNGEQLNDKKNVVLKIERDIFETLGFDFRRNSVQYTLVKICKDLERKSFYLFIKPFYGLF